MHRHTHTHFTVDVAFEFCPFCCPLVWELKASWAARMAEETQPQQKARPLDTGAFGDIFWWNFEIAPSVRLLIFSAFSQYSPKRGPSSDWGEQFQKAKPKPKTHYHFNHATQRWEPKAASKLWGLGWAAAIVSIASALHGFHWFPSVSSGSCGAHSVCLGTGCTTFTTKRTKPWKLGREKNSGSTSKVVAIYVRCIDGA